MQIKESTLSLNKLISQEVHGLKTRLLVKVFYLERREKGRQQEGGSLAVSKWTAPQQAVVESPNLREPFTNLSLLVTCGCYLAGS